jgi:hypothetical protein
MGTNINDITTKLFWVCPNKHKEPRDRNDEERTCSTCNEPMVKMLDEDKIKRLLKAMMERQESAEKIGNVGEAMMFAEKITDLLTKYELTADELVDPKIDIELMDPIFMQLTRSFNRADWMVRLATCVAEAVGARVLFPDDRNNGQMFFVGTKRARKAAINAVVGLSRLGIVLAKAELSAHRKSGAAGNDRNNGWRPSFVEAFTDNVIARLPRVDAPMNAINAFIGDEYGHVGQISIEREDKVRHDVAAERGKGHGQTVNLHIEEVK